MIASRIRVALVFLGALAVYAPVCAAQAPAPAPEAPPQTPAQRQLDVANGFFQHKFFVQAVAEYERYLAEFPDQANDPVVWYRLGEAAYAAGDHEKALAAFNTALEKGLDEETRVQATLSKGEVLYFLKRFEESASTLAGLTGSDRTPAARSRALYYLGRNQSALNQPAEAEKSLRTLLDELPGEALAPYARYELAFVLLAQNALEKSAVEFSTVAGSGIDPALRMESRFRAAEIYDKMGWYSAAADAFGKLREEFPEGEYARRAETGQALAVFHGGNAELALESAAAFLAAHPGDPLAVNMKYLQGNALQQLKRFDEALAVYTEIRQQYGDSEVAIRAQYKSAWTYYLKGDYAGAKNEILAFINVQTTSPLLGDAHFLAGTILVAEGNFEDAEQEFRLVAEKYTTSEFAAESLFKAAECLANLGLNDQAAQTFVAFATRYPDHPLTSQAMLRAGDTAFGAEDFAAAVEQYKTILGKTQEPTVEHDTLYRLALTYHNMKSFDESAGAFRQLLGKFPDSAHKAEAHYRIAENALKEKNNTDEALAEYQAAFDVDPKGEFAGRALLGLALTRYERKDEDVAASLFLRVAHEYPDLTLNETAWVWTGQYYFDHQQWDQAVDALDTLLKVVPDYPYPERALLLLAEAHEQAGRQDEARKNFEAVVEKAPESSAAAEARFKMAGIEEAAGQQEKAIALYEAAARSNSGDISARAQFRLGELYEARGAHADAARSFMMIPIMFLHEELSPQALARAGDNYAKAGDAEQARKAYQELIDDFPGTELATQAADALAKLPAG